MHDEWEKPTADPDASWTDENGQAHASESRGAEKIFSVPVMPTTYSGTTGEAQIKEWKVEWSAGAKVTLGTDFGVGFNVKDWINIKNTFKAEASLEVTATVAGTAIVSLNPGDTAYPIIKYYINTKHALVDHFNLSGWERNPGRTDGKWLKKADMTLRPQDIRPAWNLQPASNNNPTP